MVSKQICIWCLTRTIANAFCKIGHTLVPDTTVDTWRKKCSSGTSLMKPNYTLKDRVMGALQNR